MRLLMGISKDRHGTYYAIKKVPVHLQEAVAHSQQRQSEPNMAEAFARDQRRRQGEQDREAGLD